MHSATKTTQKKRFWTALLWKLENSGIVSTATFFIVDRIKWQFLFTYAQISVIHMSLLNYTHPCLCTRLTFWCNPQGTCHSKEWQSPLCFCGFGFGGKKKSNCPCQLLFITGNCLALLKNHWSAFPQWKHSRSQITKGKSACNAAD